MQTENLPATRSRHLAWNKEGIVGQKRPLLPKHVWAIRVGLEIAKKVRNLALFDLAVEIKLRGCDLVTLKVADVFAAGQVKERASIIQSKTRKQVWFEITEGACNSRADWLDNPAIAGSEYLWPERFDERLRLQRHARADREHMRVVVKAQRSGRRCILSLRISQPRGRTCVGSADGNVDAVPAGAWRASSRSDNLRKPNPNPARRFRAARRSMSSTNVRLLPRDGDTRQPPLSGYSRRAC